MRYRTAADGAGSVQRIIALCTVGKLSYQSPHGSPLAWEPLRALPCRSRHSPSPPRPAAAPLSGADRGGGKVPRS